MSATPSAAPGRASPSRPRCQSTATSTGSATEPPRGDALRLISGILSIFFPPPPLAALDDLEEGGVVSVRGRVLPRDLLESPLTGDPCVYYLYSVEEWRAPASLAVAGDGFWQLLERDEEIAEFYLQADGVRVIVSPQRAKVERAVGPPMREVDYGIVGRRARQLLIAPGDHVEVRAQVNRAHDLHDEARDYREPTSRIMLTAPDNARLQIRLLRSA